MQGLNQNVSSYKVEQFNCKCIQMVVENIYKDHTGSGLYESALESVSLHYLETHSLPYKYTTMTWIEWPQIITTYPGLFSHCT